MPQTSQLYLRVRDAPIDDYDRLVVRMHKTDKPKGIKWGDYINVSLDRFHWIACQLEQAGESGLGKIYINPRLRGFLNRDVVGGIRVEDPHDFYIKRAPYWKEPFYIMSYHPNDSLRTRMRVKIYGAIGITVIIVATVLAYTLSLSGS
ncbi:hypothetical protein ACFLXG_00860 [Chloroflexota bacterium]